jgi:hypothetical protein
MPRNTALAGKVRIIAILESQVIGNSVKQHAPFFYALLLKVIVNSVHKTLHHVSKYEVVDRSHFSKRGGVRDCFPCFLGSGQSFYVK